MDKHIEPKTPNISDLAIFCLMLIKDSKMSGYDIASYLFPFWKASHQQVYRELNKLHELGLANFTEKTNNGRPDSKLYTLTAKGEKALKKYHHDTESKIDTPYPRGRQVSMLMVENVDYFRRAIRVLGDKAAKQSEFIESLTDLKERLIAERHLKLLELEIDYAQTVIGHYG